LLETLLSQAPLGVYFVNGDFRICQVNPTALPVFGEIPGLIGRDFDEVIHILWTQEYADEIVRIFRHTLETGEPYSTPERAELRSDRGVPEYYEWRVDRILLPESRFGVVCYFRDISAQVQARARLTASETERRMAEEALQEADRQKDEFLAQLAHELRNPLAPVRNAVELLRLKAPDEPEIRWSRDVIERQVSHLTRLIDDLLDVSRITRNKLELRKQRLDLAEVVQAAVETSRPAIEQSGHELTVTLPAEPVYLYGDLVRLAQVLMNLLTNAAKYTEPGGRIWLTAELASDGRPEVVVRVKDTGMGIPAEKLPRLFEMFFQVDRSLERAQGGLGIGLSLVRRLVELHGGRVEAHSDGPGRGSEFVAHLPALVEPPKIVPSPRPAAEGETKDSGRRILVVDDNQDSADSLAMLLGMTGHEVETAYDGLEAVEAAERVRPDVVLLDLGMPRLNGYDACRRIREQPWGKDVVLIALTGWGQEEDRRRTAEAGFDGHLVKPVDHAALAELLAGRLSFGERLR
jgi:PAS domain S-box-containing protein